MIAKLLVLLVVFATVYAEDKPKLLPIPPKPITTPFTGGMIPKVGDVGMGGVPEGKSLLYGAVPVGHGFYDGARTLYGIGGVGIPSYYPYAGYYNNYYGLDGRYVF